MKTKKEFEAFQGQGILDNVSGTLAGAVFCRNGFVRVTRMAKKKRKKLK
jgi:hypothetical protein